MKPKTTRRLPINTGTPTVDRLYQAVRGYIEKNGGSVLVIGGIRIEEWPEDNGHSFYVSVKCTGLKPQFAKEQ